MAVAPAAPAVVTVGMFLIGLLALLAWAIQRGLLAVWVHTFGAVLQAMGRTLDFDIRFIHVHLGHVFFALDATVRNGLVTGAAKSEHAAGYFFHGMALIARWMARETEHLALDVLAWATWLQQVHLPKWVKAMIYAAFPPALIARLVQAAIHANLPHATTTIIYKTVPAAKAAVAKVAHATTGAVALPGWAIALPGRVGGLEHDLSGLRKRVKELEKGAAIAVTVGLAAAMLRKLKLNCLLGKNGKRLGKDLCRVDPDFFASLFLDGLLITSAISIRAFAKECIATVDFFEQHFAHFVSELKNPLQDYLGPIKGAPRSVDDLLALSFTDYLD